MTPAIATSSTGGSTSLTQYEVTDIRRYNFSYTSGGGRVIGSLAASGAKTLILSPVPVGVNGTDADHYLYISNGTGTAEKVLITGGSAVSGATIGTFHFTTVNAHTGAWTLASATAGMQECYQYQRVFNAIPSIVQMTIPVGITHFYARFTGRDRTIAITGSGSYLSIIYQHDLTSGTIACIESAAQAPRVSLKGFAVQPVGGVSSVTATLYVEDYALGDLIDLTLFSPLIGIDWNALSYGNPIIISNVYVSAAATYGIRLRSSGSGQCAGLLANFYCDGPGSAALDINGTIAGLCITNVYTQATAYGIVINGSTRSANEITIENALIDGPTTAGILCLGGSSTSGTNNIRISNSIIQHDAASNAILIQSIWRVLMNDTSMGNASSQPSMVINTATKISICGVEFHAYSSSSAGALARLIGTNDEIVFKECNFSADATSSPTANPASA